jgi:RNA-binding protein YlmH
MSRAATGAAGAGAADAAGMAGAAGIAGDLIAAAHGGRVASSPFLPPQEADACGARLRAAGVGVSIDGGRAGAERRVVTAHPVELPSAGPRLMAVWFAGALDEGTVRAALGAAGVDPGAVGDVSVAGEGASAVVTAAVLEDALRVRPAGEPGVEVPLTALAQARERSRAAVVPSLRVDALGAKAFGVSRSYFAKGIAAGRVHVNGRQVSKSAEAAAGDEVWADGLGRFRVSAVHGETRRGNLKVTIEVEEG